MVNTQQQKYALQWENGSFKAEQQCAGTRFWKWDLINTRTHISYEEQR